MSGPHKKNLREPDESIRFEGVSEDIVEIGGFTIARTVQDPGWRWSSTDPRSDGALCSPITSGWSCPDVGEPSFATAPSSSGVRRTCSTVLPDHDGYTIGDEPCVMIEWVGVRTFVAPRSGFGDRFLAALLFTDLVDSTSMVARIGDVAWHELLSEHYHVARGELERSGGKEIDTTGDGLFATFDAPARALRCAASIRDAADRQGLSIRAGVHVGEVTITQDGVRGSPCTRPPASWPPPGLARSWSRRSPAPWRPRPGLVFEDRREHALKGLEGSRRLPRTFITR